MSKRQQEEEHFARQDAEKIAKLKEQLLKAEQEKALLQRKLAHYHRCGKCGAHMSTRPFRGVEIEVCDECGAVLLDRGELETLAGSDESGILDGFLSLFGKA